jgi:ribonuclease HI
MGDVGLLTIHTDGASRGNPGAAAYAYVIERAGDPPIEEAGCLGRLTNNQAEYAALVRALNHALRLGPENSLAIYSDSELMVKQMRGEYRVKDGDLRELFDEAKALLGRFRGRVSIQHVRRAQNARADALCNEALDGKRQPTPHRDPPPKTGPTIAEEALACLRQAAQTWSEGAKEPTPEEVWEELKGILARHGIQLPSERPA